MLRLQQGVDSVLVSPRMPHGRFSTANRPQRSRAKCHAGASRIEQRGPSTRAPWEPAASPKEEGVGAAFHPKRWRESINTVHRPHGSERRPARVGNVESMHAFDVIDRDIGSPLLYSKLRLLLSPVS